MTPVGVARMVQRSSGVRPFFVYIVANAHDTVLYVGVTSNLKRRIEAHLQGKVGAFSQRYRCTKLVYFDETSDVHTALAREKQLKGWRREKKIALIARSNPEWRDLIADCE
jgi:putative endonuclease